MKKIISVILIIIFTFSLFVGCDNNQNGELSKNIKDIGIADGSVKDDKSDNEAANKIDEIDKSDKNTHQGTIIKHIVPEEDACKEPISFECNGKILTLKFFYTDIIYTDMGYSKSYKFHNGVVCLPYGTYLTKDGKIIAAQEYENNYKTISESYPEYVGGDPMKLPNGNYGRPVGNGLALDMTGEPGNYTQWLYNENGELLTPTGFDSIGYFNEDGIAIITKDHKVGFIDEKGNIILEPVDRKSVV